MQCPFFLIFHGHYSLDMGQQATAMSVASPLPYSTLRALRSGAMSRHGLHLWGAPCGQAGTIRRRTKDSAQEQT